MWPSFQAGKRNRNKNHSRRRVDRLARRRLTMETLEGRELLSISPSPLADNPFFAESRGVLSESGSEPAAQVFLLDFNGASNVSYDGPLKMSGLQVPAFRAAGALAGREDEIAVAISAVLNQLFAPTHSLFVLAAPISGPYSTIYVGGSDAAFAPYGNFFGLAENVDAGNRNQSDDAFVFSDAIGKQAAGCADFIHSVTAVTAHEAGHLLGYTHDVPGFSHGDPMVQDVAVDSLHSMLTAVAYMQPAHRYATGQAIEVINGLADPIWDWDSFGAVIGPQLGDGAYGEDDGIKWMNHFFDPDTQDGLTGFANAMIWAKDYWENQILPLYRDGNTTTAWHYLGNVTHLIEDMTLPAHVLLDPHPKADSYEDYMAVDANYTRWSVVPGTTTALQHFATLDALFEQTAEIADDYDSNDRDGERHGDPNYSRDVFYTTGRPEEFSVEQLARFASNLFPTAFGRAAEVIDLFARTARPTFAVVESLRTATGFSSFNAVLIESGPDLQQVEFEQSTDGSNWTDLGTDNDGSDGWNFSCVQLPAGVHVRARALDKGGLYSEWTEATRILSSGGDTSVNATAKGSQMLPAAAVNPSTGSTVVVWQGPDTEEGSSGTNIFLRTLGPSGEPVEAVDVQVNIAEKDVQRSSPAIASDGAGNMVVVWCSSKVQTDAGGQPPKYLNRVQMRRLSPLGVPTGEETVIATAFNDVRREPAIAMNAQGRFVVSWTNGTATNEDIYAQAFAANGQAATQPLTIAANATYKESKSALAIDSDGQFTVAWQTKDSNGLLKGVYMRRFAANGAPRDPAEVAVASGPFAGQQGAPRLAIGNEGSGLIAWQNYVDAQTGADVFASLISTNGVPSAAFRVNPTADRTQATPAVSVDDSGVFTVVWVGESAQSGEGYDIYARRYDQQGQALDSGDSAINTRRTDMQNAPCVVAAADGALTLVWQSGESDDEGDDQNRSDGFGIFSQRYIALPTAPTKFLAWIDSNGRVQLSWNASPGAMGYILERSNSPGGPWNSVYSGKDLAFSDVQIPQDVTYYYRLRAKNNFGESAWSTTQVRRAALQSVGMWLPPTLKAQPGEAVRPGGVTLVATSAVPPAGSVTRMNFYRESNGQAGLQIGSDQAVAEDVDATNGWSAAVSTMGLMTGTQICYAVATDDRGTVSPAASVTFLVRNALPAIESVTSAPNPVKAGEVATLTANEVTDADGTVQYVNFYRESNGMAGLQTGAGGDLLVAQDTVASDGWKASMITAGLATGKYTVYAQAADNEAAVSEAAATLVTVQSQTWVVPTLTVQPAAVARPSSVVLIATGAVPPVGSVKRMNFYRESNGQAGLQIGSDQAVAQDVKAANGWSAAVSTKGLMAGAHTYYAVATDDRGTVSPATSATLLVRNASPAVKSVRATPDSVAAGGVVALTAKGVADADGTVKNVAFYRESNEIAGLQTGAGGDLLLAQDTMASNGWRASMATAGLAAGTYTVYAQATDNEASVSEAATTRVTVRGTAANLSLTLNQTSISENGGTTLGTIARSGNLSRPLVVTLGSSDRTEASVLQQVTIPAGKATAVFTVEAVDDRSLDGTQNVVITATAAGYSPSSTGLDVTDFETLTVTLDRTQLWENDTVSVVAWITRSNTDDVLDTLEVQLASSDPGEARIQSAVWMPSGYERSGVHVSAVADGVVDGTQTVTISAIATGFVTIAATIDILDINSTLGVL